MEGLLGDDILPVSCAGTGEGWFLRPVDKSIEERSGTASLDIKSSPPSRVRECVYRRLMCVCAGGLKIVFVCVCSYLCVSVWMSGCVCLCICGVCVCVGRSSVPGPVAV